MKVARRHCDAMWQFAIAVLLVVIFSAMITPAQNNTGQMTGQITNQSGAVVPGAAITITSVDTGATRTVTANERGIFIATNLQPGVYKVSIQATGVTQPTQQVEVRTGSTTTVNTTQSSTAATGEAQPQQETTGVEVNTENQQLSNLTSGRQIRELPTVTRNPFDLVTLSGNVIPVNTRDGINTAGPSTTTSRGVSYSINGQHPMGNNLQLDGGEMVRTFQSEQAQQLPLEAVHEIHVITNNYLPSYGRAVGGIISLSTRQGSNNLHGSLYEFHRNSELSSNSFENKAFGIPQGHLVANQFGYSIGGPIKRDRMFFFNSTEGNLVRSREDRLALVPAPELLAVSAAATRNFFGAFPVGPALVPRAFTVGEVRNLIGLTSPVGNAFAALPSTLPAFNLVRFNNWTDVGAGLPQDTLLTAGRFDWQVSDRSLLYARYAFEHRDFFEGTYSLSPFQGFDAGAGQRNHDITLNWSSTFMTWNYNSIVSFNRMNPIRSLGAEPPVPRLTITGAGDASIGNIPIALPGFQPFSNGSGLTFSGPENLLHVNQDFKATWQDHQFGFGGSYFYTQDNRRFGLFNNAALGLGANLPEALSNLVRGTASTFQTAIDTRGLAPGQLISLPLNQPNFNGRGFSTHDFALYFNDYACASAREHQCRAAV